MLGVGRKKFIMTISCLMIVALMFHWSGNVFAEDEDGVYSNDEYKWIVKPDGTVEIIDYIGTDKDVVIPSELDGRKVTSIQRDLPLYRAFEEKGIESVVIPATVTYIGKLAFDGNEDLKRVTILNGRIHVYDNIFGRVFGWDVEEYYLCEGSPFYKDESSRLRLAPIPDEADIILIKEGCEYNEPEFILQDNFVGASFRITSIDQGTGNPIAEESYELVMTHEYDASDKEFYELSEPWVVDRGTTDENGQLLLRVIQSDCSADPVDGIYAIRKVGVKDNYVSSSIKRITTTERMAVEYPNEGIRVEENISALEPERTRGYVVSGLKVIVSYECRK